MKTLTSHEIAKPNVEDNKKNLHVFSLNYFLRLFRLNSKNKKVISAYTSGLGLILLIVIIFLIHHVTSSVSSFAVDEKSQTQTIVAQLSDVNKQLQTLSSSSQDTNEFREALAKVSKDVSVIGKTVGNLAKASDVREVSSEISSMHSDVDEQMLDLKRVVANSSKGYLDPKVLPFHVISLDVISEQPFVSIDYDHHLTPLTIGDSMAGWQITSADYSSGEVEFKNDHNQYVKVLLQG
jgi:chaperonin cofactor prefoldin